VGELFLEGFFSGGVDFHSGAEVRNEHLAPNLNCAGYSTHLKGGHGNSQWRLA